MQRTIAKPQTMVRRMVRVKSTATSLLLQCNAERRSLSRAQIVGKAGSRLPLRGAMGASAAGFLDLGAGRFSPFRLAMQLLAVLHQAGHEDFKHFREFRECL
jgi:hypothetical protein